ncbi:MAG TPA: methyl-accepting chemotaxis protein, partial [Coleofasciculaceae cyanobacterium]
TFLMDSGEMDDEFTTNRDNVGYISQSGIDATEALQESSYLPDDQLDEPHYDQNGFNSHEQFDFVSFDEPFGNDSFEGDEVSEPQEGSFSGIESRHSVREGFLDEFDVFDDDLGAIPDFSLDDREDLSHDGPDESDFDLLSNGGGVPGASSSIRLNDSSSSLNSEDEMFSISTPSEQIPIFSQPKEADSEPIVSVEQGWLSFFENAALKQKQWYTAAASGVVSALMVALVSFISASVASTEEKPTVVDHLRKTSGLMTLAAGLAGFGTTWALGRITTRQIHRATTDLQKQFDAISQGNLNASATIYSEDEFGQLAAGFNQMARVILTTTSEAQRKAEEQEQAKEDLQRQVIRLLDDVEGAARGDLTVQAEVTADVLGAVADSFNLTIQNLREIVQQVKQAARQVNKGASDSEIFARSLSSDALRQAEELAVTLNSVQVMTDLIGRVAESAKEAEDVARSASATALKGGEAVERTVGGILQIRETVAETTRKVKRLAESSQEISKIVALISQIASRTNLLALNASIEAARAGEAGRGFAIVADEVRQLADRSAKALKEIEQIVLQIQSETSSVMTAMEEGTQQVIDGTRRAEQAKRSLEDIVQVSNRIDALVRSIAADTVEQTETSRAVAQVMQSVELTAQETSQEAQRVSGALQNLVGVARDLLTSVERFRVESNGGK